MQKICESDINIIPMTEESLKSVGIIERDLFEHPWSEDMYRAELNKDNSFHYVVVLNDEIAGYYGFYKTYDNEAEVTNIAVAKKYQGQGIGNCIMSSMIENAIKLCVDTIFLEVRASNHKAIRLYKKFGFTQINIRKKYYEGVEDAVIMRWQR